MNGSLFNLSLQPQIEVEPYDYPIDPVAVSIGGQICLDLNVTVPGLSDLRTEQPNILLRSKHVQAYLCAYIHG
jgi:hypothetical protein